MPDSPILERCLHRLYAALASGPGLNCRPHRSRQRVDWTRLADLGAAPTEALEALLGGRIQHRPAHVRPAELAEDADEVAALAHGEALTAWTQQEALLRKLRTIAADARTWEREVGVGALALGLPVLSLPPGSTSRRSRVLAPIAYLPLEMSLPRGPRGAVELRCREAGAGRVIVNPALLAWIERELGEPLELVPDLDEASPWDELRSLVAVVAERLGLEPPEGALPPAEAAGADEPEGDEGRGDELGGRELQPAESIEWRLQPVPATAALGAGPQVLPCAVLGLFGASNIGLIRDLKGLIAAPELPGSVAPFLEADALDRLEREAPGLEPSASERAALPGETRLIARADPCQLDAVQTARRATALVIHGPPGTGKSQTITNVIGDHLARGQRVLFVCDKRTALDVVARRLEHLGLGHLCARVHDPVRDRRDLYMQVRAQLDRLPELEVDPEGAERALARAGSEADALHRELAALAAALHDGPRPFSELVAAWLALDDGSPPLQLAADESALERCRIDLEVLFERSAALGPEHPWPPALTGGAGLDAYLAEPAARWRERLEALQQLARAVGAGEAIEGVEPQAADLKDRLAALDALDTALAALGEAPLEPALAELASAADPALERALADRQSELAALPALEPELALALPDAPPMADLNRALTALERCLAARRRWWWWLSFARHRAAREALAPFGIELSDANLERARAHLASLKRRLLLDHELQRELPALFPGGERFDPAAAAARVQALAGALRARAASEAAAQPLADAELMQPAARAARRDQLRERRPRLAALLAFAEAAAAHPLLGEPWRRQLLERALAGTSPTEALAALGERDHQLEDALRMASAVAALPETLREAAADRARRGAPAAASLAAIRRAALAHELRRRVAEDPLAGLDPLRVERALARLSELTSARHPLVLEAIQARWIARQRERLLARTGSRLGSLGAALRGRLYVRGARALRLRQAIDQGREIDGGDPLFDCCPVWLASPETVAQVLPLEPLFDVVIFDEASQLRVEEAMPVLARAGRVVVAGDPQQLPPTRFFEGAVQRKDEPAAADAQGRFEQRQGEVEDLLAAALNLAVEQRTLDVHYRSRREALIAFSNEHFYGGRLQALPAHPDVVSRHDGPAISLTEVEGRYQDRRNPLEAEAVVARVASLLDREAPPSIGIACFNLPQRDAILEALEQRAAEDERFAERLDRAREREGDDGFEGLFVKNLESVQGDERDEIIISTTYGPDARGRFYRRFGPLGQAGGGRRLNVLVTRARERVHVISSIPARAYREASPPSGEGGPSGGWLLLAYLRFASALAEQRETAAPGGRAVEPACALAEAVGALLAADRPGAELTAGWGNAGFSVDLAVSGDGGRWAGVLLDFNRYPGALDRVGWEAYRLGILEHLGWRLQRLWSPELFRDRARARAQLISACELGSRGGDLS